jgi:hypothetical protein
MDKLQMTFPADGTWLEQLAAKDEKALAETANTSGFIEPAKTAANLVLLQETLSDPQIIVSLARHALTTADPDLALNNLERLCGTVDKTDLPIVFVDDTSAKQLLTLLGASQFLSGILCRQVPSRDFSVAGRYGLECLDVQYIVASMAKGHAGVADMKVFVDGSASRL